MSSTSTNNFEAIAILEKDNNGDVLWTWTYPSIAADLKAAIDRKTGLRDEELQNRSIFANHKSSWFYIQSNVLGTPETVQVPAVAIVIVSKNFHPELYIELAKALLSQYSQGFDASRVLEGYLQVVTRGQFETFTASKFDLKHTYLKPSIKDVIAKFSMESILIYTAMMLKKRVVVYSPDPETLLAVIRVIPQFAWHRQCWDLLFPWLHLNAEEVSNIKGQAAFVAGFTEAEIIDKEQLYDILIDGLKAPLIVHWITLVCMDVFIMVQLSANTIKISSDAKDAFTMGKLHKEIAQFLVSTIGNADVSDKEVVKELASKTLTILDMLRGFGTVSDNGQVSVSREAIQGQKLQVSVQSFLVNLAAAENILAQ